MLRLSLSLVLLLALSAPAYAEGRQDLEVPPEDDPEHPVGYGGVEGTARRKNPQFQVAAGPLVLFGVASWQPAVGVDAEIRFRPKGSFLSVALEGRAAWGTKGIAGLPIYPMTGSGLLSACGHWRWFFGCATTYVGFLRISVSADALVHQSFVVPANGSGGRIGATVYVGRSFFLQGAIDGLYSLNGITIAIEGNVISRQPGRMFGSQVLGGWEF